LVDAPSIESRLERLRELLAELDQIRGGGRGTWDADPRLRLATERALQLSIQVCIDIAGHLVAELNLPMPPDYRVGLPRRPPQVRCLRGGEARLRRSRTAGCDAVSA
jgi:uncharacterized protein YutE (UPF0331/DUF86 family)